MSNPFLEIPSETHSGDATSGPNIDVADLVEESIAVFDLNLHVTAWNTGAERLYGWKRDEVIGGVIQAFVHCSPSEPLKVILARVHETGAWRGEFIRTAKGGKRVAVKAKWSLRGDAAGAPLDIVETSRDITEVKRTEEALDRVQYQYQNLFQASVASFWELEFSHVGEMVKMLLKSGVSDLREYFGAHPEYVRQMIQATRIVDVNDQTLLMFGNGDRDAVLRNLDAFWPDESLPIFAESVVSAFEKKTHYSAEAVFYSLDGQRFDTLFTVSYPSKMLQCARLLVGIIDVTQAKKAKAAQEKSERRYRDVFHFLPVPLLQLDGREVVNIFNQARSEGVADFAEHLRRHPDILAKLLEGLKIVEVNRRTVEMFRGQSAEEFKGSVARYWTESPDIFAQVLAARYAGKPGFEAHVKMRAHDGTMLDALFFTAFGPVTGEEHVSLVGLIDVSERIKAQEMLAHLQADLAHAARISVLGELTASIAHEVSQPLTAIESNTEASLLWLDHTPPNLEEVRDLSTRTALEAQRAAAIIHRIRSMVMRTGPEQKSLELNGLIRDALLFLWHELQRNGVEASLQLAPVSPVIIGDRVQLQQVIVNLAINAIQAMALANSTPKVLTMRTGVRRDGLTLVDVEDTGPGIADYAFERLFESFFTTKATGMGIGLPISRSIIEAHGGQMSVSNREDRTGARFSVLLPTQPAAGEDP